MGHYCDGEEDTFRLLKTGIPVVEVAEAEKPRLLQPMDISADRLHYSNKEINNYLHSDLLIPWENEEKHASYLDTIHWPFLLVYDKILFFLYIPTLLFCSVALFVCLIMLEMVSNFAQIFSTHNEVDVNSLQHKKQISQNTPIVWF